tara:strand:+ start:228 stop:407 length:180 start_codon:yes stop_codon:yes gene_type:complete
MLSYTYITLITMAKKGLYYNINKRKKAGTSRSKKDSTISPQAYKNMQAGFPKKKNSLDL